MIWFSIVFTCKSRIGINPEVFCEGQSEVMRIFFVNHHDGDDSDVDYYLFLSTIISMMMLVMLFRPSFPSALDGGGCERQS